MVYQPYTKHCSILIKKEKTHQYLVVAESAAENHVESLREKRRKEK
jgi:hypothetical protein